MANNTDESNIRGRSLSEKYVDIDGNEQQRGDGADLNSLDVRHIEVIINLPGFSEDKELGNWMGLARLYYEQGDYTEALRYLSWAVERMPSLEPYIYYYMRVCERAIAIPLTKEELEYEAKVARYRALPKWLKWTVGKLKCRVRCKWCGRYTEYIHPNDPTFGMSGSTPGPLCIPFMNQCTSCGRTYPMPSWLWDSPDGRAYSYYRHSFGEDEFYREFENDYDLEGTVPAEGPGAYDPIPQPVLDDQGWHERKCKSYAEALMQNPGNQVAYYNWGTEFLRFGDYEKACEKLSKAVKLKPDFADAYHNWGMALHNLGRAREAKEKLRKAHELGFEPPSGWPEWYEQTD